MKLNSIARGDQPIQRRVLHALRTGGLQQVMDEFGCDIQQAVRLVGLLKGGTYGEADVDDKITHRARAPQNIMKLLAYFQVSPAVAKKLIRFHIDNYAKIANHRPSPPDFEALRQFRAGERPATMCSTATMLDWYRNHGYMMAKTPWSDKHDPDVGVWYVVRPQDRDLLQELLTSRGHKLDLLHGLAFGYKLVDVFNFIRSEAPEVVDALCGHVDHMAR